MSLDVYLESAEKTKKVCFHCDSQYEVREELYSANITHNLGTMASQAGLYYALWRPEEIGAIYAKDIIKIVENGLVDLEARPEYFSQFNAKNGWGMYEHFVPFVRNYLNALKEYPESIIKTSI